ncbi:MAG: hypothetical protein R3B81_13530 [bacterium]
MTRIFAAATFVSLLATPLFAASIERWIGNVTAITEPETHVGRVLFTADLSVPEEHVAVRRAYLRVPLPLFEASRAMTLRVHPVTTAWSRGAVGWTSGWSRAGGDFEDLVHGRAEIAAGGGGEAVFDITILAKEILEHDVPNRGFILTIDPGEGVGVPAADLEGLGALTGATIDVSYRKTAPRPRRRQG